MTSWTWGSSSGSSKSVVWLEGCEVSISANVWSIYRDGSKLRQGAEAQSLNESTGGSLAFGNP